MVPNKREQTASVLMPTRCAVHGRVRCMLGCGAVHGRVPQRAPQRDGRVRGEPGGAHGAALEDLGRVRCLAPSQAIGCEHAGQGAQRWKAPLTQTQQGSARRVCFVHAALGLAGLACAAS